MHLKVPPVAVFLIAAGLLAAGAWLLPVLNVAAPGRLVPAALLALAGMVPALQAVRAFVKKKTTFNPMAPDRATTLVSGGIYRFSRNPMYLGLACLLMALALCLGTLTAVVIVPGFVWYMTEFQIRPEEDSLRKRFGDAYDDYRAQVRRWI
ncbi:isoprenylcysteine carboxylmethyltransferase family protein [Roseibium sp.]|uniref:methyltransferase family protein n=1 Tax=Roseibium sp. TaxID=1936156 RepID=UPI0032656940